MTSSGGPWTSTRPTSMATRRLTTERRAWTMCSIQTIATPSPLMRRTSEISSGSSSSVSPPAISSSSSTRGRVASARASSRRLRSSSVSAPARVLALRVRPVSCSAVTEASAGLTPARPELAPTSTFSKTVSASNGWGIWWVRAMPARHRACGGRRVTSRPAKRTAPRSGRRRPISKLSAVVLPAPLGPMTPSASPSSTARLIPPMTTSEQKDLNTPPTASKAGMGSPLADGLRLPERLQCPSRGDVRRRLVTDDDHVEGEVLALHPLATDERGLGDVGHGPLGPADRSHDRVEVGGLDRGDDRGLVVHARRPLQRIEADLEERVDEAERLRPLLLGLRRVGGGQLARGGAGERRLERMLRRPPYLSGHAGAERAQRLHRAREEQGLAHAGDLGLEALLGGLLPERRPVRGDRHAGDDLDLGVLEGRDLRGEIVAQVRVAAGIDQRVAGLGQHGWEAALLVPPRVAVAVVGPERADDPVGGDRAPHVEEDADDVFQPPEEVIGRLEAGVGLAPAREEPRLPRADARDARRAVDLALVRDRIGRLRRARDQHEVDLVRKDQPGGHLGRPVRIRLAVAHDDLDGKPLPLDRQAGGRLADAPDHKRVTLAESGQRPRLRAHVADLERAPLGQR